MAKVCREIHEWIEEKIEKRIEERRKKRTKKCKKKKCNWWTLCLNKLFCWLIWVFYIVVQYVFVWTIKWIIRIICEIVDLVLDIAAAIVNIIFLIPIIGPVIKQLFNLIKEIFWRIVGLPGLIMCAFGAMPTKMLQICIVITSDGGKPVATAATLDKAIKNAQNIYMKEAKIKLVVNGIHEVSNEIEASCGGSAYWEDINLTTGGQYAAMANLTCYDGNFDRLMGKGGPICVFVLKDISGSLEGCSLGPLANYVTVEANNNPDRDARCLAHELGHALGLWHHDGANNMMNKNCGGTNLKKWQVCIIRNSRHVSVFPGTLASVISSTSLI